MKKSLEISSSVFENNQNIPQKFTCAGENISPPLSISGVPGNAKSLALMVDDPDAPAGTFVHWIVYYLPPNVINIPEGILPEGSRTGLNGTGKAGYTGPCPPSGMHHYQFKLYALDIVLTFDSPPDKKAVEDAMLGHILDSAELIGLYSKT